MGFRSILLVALLLLTPAFASLPTASACASTSVAVANVPCGRIYPLILIKIEDQLPKYPLDVGEGLSWTAQLTYKFGLNDNGYTVALPNEPVDVTFEFPRKPGWVDLVVEPERINIPVNDPRYLQVNVDDPNNPQVEYSYTTDITIKARLNGAQPVIRDGYDFAKLLVFAKSTESGLYQAGYGIKEIRVSPAGALFESDIAGSRDVFTASPLAPAKIEGGFASFAGTTVTLVPPAEVPFWQSAPWEVQFDPAPSGRVAVSITQEDGALVAFHGPAGAQGGSMTFNVTLAHPGRHVAAVTLLPVAGSPTPSVTLHVPFTAGDIAAEGFAYPKSYTLTTTQAVPAPGANTADPMTQWTRDIPFFAFDTAQSTVASVELVTPAAGALGRSLANLQFSIIDPEGKQLQINSVDPLNPVRPVRVGSLPGDGWYTLRISGAGVPAFASYTARVEVAYALPPEARNHADGTFDLTGPLLSLAGTNLTLPVDALKVWAPTQLRPQLEGSEGMTYSLTVIDSQGRLALASGARTGDVSFTTPRPGVYQATVFVEPTPGASFAPLARTFTFRVGEGSETVATAFELDDVATAVTSVGETFLSAYQIPVPGTPQDTTLQFGRPALATLRFVLLDASGNEAFETTSETGASAQFTLDPAAGPYTMIVYSTNPGPATPFQLSLLEQFAAPVTLTDADAPGPVTTPARIPGFAVALALAAIGAVAVSIALLRRP